MKVIKKLREILGHIASAFCISKTNRRHVRKLIENYSFKQAKIYKNFKHQIISLGNNCMGRTIPTKFGLKPTKIYGEQTIVTDQIFFPYIKDLVKFWNTNFEGMLDDLCFNKDMNAWTMPRYGMYAPHEYQLSKEEFSKAVERRIKNFYKMVETDKYAIFLRFDAHDCSKESVKLLADKIREVRKGKPYKLVIVNHKKPLTDYIDENTIVINYPLTLSEKWPLELETEEGKKFCASFIEPIKKIISEI